MPCDRLRNSLCAVLLGACVLPTAGLAQVPVTSPEWVEDAAPPPPAFNKNAILLLDMPRYISLKVGIDPQTITVGNDGIVRYVVVMTNATGTLNAIYEGIRCNTDEVKTYARWGSAGQWSLVAQPQWRDLTDNQPSPHAHVFARQAACPGHLAGTQAEITSALKQTSTPLSR